MTLPWVHPRSASKQRGIKNHLDLLADLCDNTRNKVTSGDKITQSQIAVIQ